MLANEIASMLGVVRYAKAFTKKLLANVLLSRSRVAKTTKVKNTLAELILGAFGSNVRADAFANKNIALVRFGAPLI